jgi:hypothetical protein
MQTFRLESLSRLELCNVVAERTQYRGRAALRLIEHTMRSDEPTLAIVIDSKFKDGIIETAIAGSPRADAPMDMRGFVRIGFRVKPHASHFEYFFIRPTTGAPTISCAAIIQLSIVRIPSSPGSDCEKKARVSTNRMPILSPESGRISKSSDLVSGRNCM